MDTHALDDEQLHVLKTNIASDACPNANDKEASLLDFTCEEATEIRFSLCMH